ncbi:MAG TPA: DHHA1 domain-containing protein, partial [Polyangiaceae bacterium]|nr:DHHA1 domain-containing protein [Polyangiaceae bacterium]
CDGITATAIMTEILRELGGSVTPLLANRFAGGYGVSHTARERIEKTGARVLVTCDCGSSDHETLALLQAAGLDIIVIDHHLVPDRPLPALAFLNPHRPECGFAYKGLASCGLALSIGAALRSELGVNLDVKRWLDLVAIGTIADVAPLTGDNRALVRHGLQRIASGDRPGLRALLHSAKVELGTVLGARDVAFKLAPRLNAPGRLGAPDLTLDLLLAKDNESAFKLAEQLEDLSTERKKAQAQMLDEAMAQIEREGYQQQAAIVVSDAKWNPGIVGIVAGRLAELYNKPVVVCGVEGGSARGSVRGPRGFRLHDAVSAVQDVLVRFGGHQAAAGLEVLPEKIADFRKRFVEECARAQAPAADESASTVIALDPRDELLAIVEDMDRLEPCGEGNPRPKIAIIAQVAQARAVKGGHLKFDLQLSSGRQVSCFRLGDGERASSLIGVQVRAEGDIRRNNWPGGAPVELLAESLVAQA